VAERTGAQGMDAFSLLSTIGRDCVGALQFLPQGETPTAMDHLEGTPVSEAEIESILKNLKFAPLGLERDNDFRISVAGAQEKTALLFHDGKWLVPHGTTPTTHIVKPQIGALPIGIDLSNSVENEHYCLELLRSFGLPVANTQIARFGAIKALVVERFDRTRQQNGSILRLPQEDCCQALSVPPTLKYQSDGGPGIVEILKLLQASDDPLVDQDRFLKANILFWLIGATDGHAKNFSIAFTEGGRFTMTPLYDVISVQPSLDVGQLLRKDMRLAMRVGTGRHYRIQEITGRHFVETAAQANISKSRVLKLFDDIRNEATLAFDQTLARMPADFPHTLHASLKAAMEERLLRTNNND
jgi:serine/threonine-protein kinase HipA